MGYRAVWIEPDRTLDVFDSVLLTLAHPRESKPCCRRGIVRVELKGLSVSLNRLFELGTAVICRAQRRVRRCPSRLRLRDVQQSSFGAGCITGKKEHNS